MHSVFGSKGRAVTDKPPIFQYVDSILKTKQDLMRNNDLRENQYVPFMVNRALSQPQNLDCWLYAAEMNLRSDLPKQMQYDYYLASVPKLNRRVGAWVKSGIDKEISALMLWFQVSRRDAEAFRYVLKPDVVKDITEKCEDL